MTKRGDSANNFTCTANADDLIKQEPKTIETSDLKDTPTDLETQTPAVEKKDAATDKAEYVEPKSNSGDTTSGNVNPDKTSGNVTPVDRPRKLTGSISKKYNV